MTLQPLDDRLIVEIEAAEAKQRAESFSQKQQKKNHKEAPF